eukprot:TRINITY_DN7668_c0_g1_i1.p1 TRINITY_DN7668_c0_g1~~TRINITY_DN7668_c0_g1_i1.p1  ORF type:complete len:393 (+),score=14.06 TRINITY_DN7668_c0_g1_i1:61-1179(+)
MLSSKLCPRSSFSSFSSHTSHVSKATPSRSLLHLVALCVLLSVLSVTGVQATLVLVNGTTTVTADGPRVNLDVVRDCPEYAYGGDCGTTSVSSFLPCHHCAGRQTMGPSAGVPGQNKSAMIANIYGPQQNWTFIVTIESNNTVQSTYDVSTITNGPLIGISSATSQGNFFVFSRNLTDLLVMVADYNEQAKVVFKSEVIPNTKLVGVTGDGSSTAFALWNNPASDSYRLEAYHVANSPPLEDDCNVKTDAGVTIIGGLTYYTKTGRVYAISSIIGSPGYQLGYLSSNGSATCEYTTIATIGNTPQGFPASRQFIDSQAGLFYAVSSTAPSYANQLWVVDLNTGKLVFDGDIIPPNTRHYDPDVTVYQTLYAY